MSTRFLTIFFICISILFVAPATSFALSDELQEKAITHFQAHKEKRWQTAGYQSDRHGRPS